MALEPPIPETRVLAVASHVVSGHVGNKIAVFAMQSLGCDVAALNTVQFSNHTGYGQWKGSRVSADEITSLWEGLKQSHLDDFDMMLSGYIPGAAAVQAVGRIAEELQSRTSARPGSFFWVLDPVMGDNGSLYVAQDVLPAYRGLLRHADLILPNQFEAELLSEVKIQDLDSLAKAIQVLHERYRIPHIVITSVSFPHSAESSSPAYSSSLSVIGSSMTSASKPRPFRIVFPAFECYFSGTGDMFAALMVVRMREAVGRASDPNLGRRVSWLSDDAVDALDLPLARAAEKVLASMHEVLTKTCEAMHAEMGRAAAAAAAADAGDVARSHQGAGSADHGAKEMRLLRSRASELRLVRNLDSLRDPKVHFRAQSL